MGQCGGVTSTLDELLGATSLVLIVMGALTNACGDLIFDKLP
jgi:hypothetical protein